MRSATLAALRSMFLVLLLASCGSSGAKPDADGAGNEHVDCGALWSYSPIVTVVYADTASPVCNPTFTVVDWPDGGPMAPLDGMPYACGGTPDFVGCPGAPADGGASPCAYVLLGLTTQTLGTSTYGLQVSQAGYAPAVVSVMSGVGGCTPEMPESHTTVTLHPIL